MPASVRASWRSDWERTAVHRNLVKLNQAGLARSVSQVEGTGRYALVSEGAHFVCEDCGRPACWPRESSASVQLGWTLVCLGLRSEAAAPRHLPGVPLDRDLTLCGFSHPRMIRAQALRGVKAAADVGARYGCSVIARSFAAASGAPTGATKKKSAP